MPASPIKVKLDNYPVRWKWKQKIIIPDENTGSLFKVCFLENAKDEWYACLLGCSVDEDIFNENNWVQVENLWQDNRSVLDTIEMVFEISFHKHIINN